MFRVPKKTSVNKAPDPFRSDQVQSFASELVKFIKDRKKWKTYRYADNKYGKLKVGQIVGIKEYGQEIPFGKAIIKNISLTTFKDLPVTTEGHESYKDKDNQRKVFNGYYAFLGRSISDDDKFLIFEFELI